mmetsp:Transcript_18545/g.58103  ORF Transcript_18545/g.58103 Transcript_18545/m.58103 type:complete len:329 (+) Transcript_18545:11-997(+)
MTRRPVEAAIGVAAASAMLLGPAGLAEAADVTAPAYNEREALTYVNYARAAFCTSEAITRWDCGEACEGAPVVNGSVRFFGPGENWQVQGYVARLPAPSGQCVVAFRGSIVWQNWLADAYFLLEDWPPQGSGRESASWCSDCRVHRGFASAYEELRPAIVASLRGLNCTSTAVVGHSLGGALASLAMLDLRAAEGLRVEPAYTFGKPRVGNQAYVEALLAAAKKQGVEPASWRVVHYRDPVPRMPPATEHIGLYAHEPHEVFYDTRSSDFTRECEHGVELVNGHEDPTCSWAAMLAECINLDHLDYLNKSMAYRKMDAKCTGAATVLV